MCFLHEYLEQVLKPVAKGSESATDCSIDLRVSACAHCQWNQYHTSIETTATPVYRRGALLFCGQGVLAGSLVNTCQDMSWSGSACSLRTVHAGCPSSAAGR